MSSESKRAKSKTKNSRSAAEDDHGSSPVSDPVSHDMELSSSEHKRRKSSDKTSSDSSKSETVIVVAEKPKKMKSLVTMPIPSLLLPSIVSTGSESIYKPKIVEHKSGVKKKGLVAKSLMDLQFEDRSRNTSRDMMKKNKKAGLLPDPVSVYLADHNRQRRKNPSVSEDYNDRNDAWWKGKDILKSRRSWTESEAVSPSLFNSHHKPLVVESEPILKVRKTSYSPKSLLESQKSSSYTLSSPKKLSGRPSRDDVKSSIVHHPHKIAQVCCIKKKSHILIFPSSLPWVHLHGRAKVTVLKGVVTVLAHTLTPGTSYDVFSPSSNCLLSLQVDLMDPMSPQDVLEELTTLKLPKPKLEDLSAKSIGIIKVEQLPSVLCDHMVTLSPFTKLFTPTLPPEMKHASVVGVTLFDDEFKIAPESEMHLPCMKWNDGYNNALDQWLEIIDKEGVGELSPVFLSCGAKNSGKSMFNRCAINTSLRNVPEIAYLDCDVGQSEFSPAATLSLHVISKPVLSPPFCHQRQAEKMVFYGDVNPSQDPSLYVQCLVSVFEAYKELAKDKKLPLIVNTMGFPIGVGLMLFVDTLNIAKPDIVVQFEVDQLFGNFPPVTQELIALKEGWTFNKCSPPDVKERVKEVKEHTLLYLSSLNVNEKVDPAHRMSSHKLHPADLRNLSMYAALSAGLSKGETLASLTPYTVPYQALGVHISGHCLKPEEVLMAIDTSVVALCQADLTQGKRHKADFPLILDDMPICDCLGLAIVRGVDTEKGVLYISCSLPRHLLRRTNTIIKGSLALPEHFILKQRSTSDYPVPYVDTLARATAAFKLHTRNHMSRPGKQGQRLL